MIHEIGNGTNKEKQKKKKKKKVGFSCEETQSGEVLHAWLATASYIYISDHSNKKVYLHLFTLYDLYILSNMYWIVLVSKIVSSNIINVSIC